MVAVDASDEKHAVGQVTKSPEPPFPIAQIRDRMKGIFTRAEPSTDPEGASRGRSEVGREQVGDENKTNVIRKVTEGNGNAKAPRGRQSLVCCGRTTNAVAWALNKYNGVLVDQINVWLPMILVHVFVPDAAYAHLKR